MGVDVTTLTVTCLVLLALGYGVFVVLGRSSRFAPVVREAWPILHSETLIVGVVAGAFWIGGWGLAIGLLALNWRIGFEAATVLRRLTAMPPPIFLGALTAIAGFGASYVKINVLVIGALAVFAALCAYRLVGPNMSANSSKAGALELAIFPGVPLVVVTAVGLQGGYASWLLATFILVETFDSYALLGGKLFGKTKAFPNFSPNKTIEGLVLGTGMLMLTAALAGSVLAGLPVLASGGVALLVGLLAVAGDLAASRLKRRSGVKDYPRILAHQGGLFDIFDAWICAGFGVICIAVLFGLG